MLSDSIHATAPHHLAELLRPGSALSSGWSADELAEILRHQMTVPVKLELIPAAGERPDGPQATDPHADLSFREFLGHPLPSLPLLREVKDYAKAARSDPRGALPAEIATVLYFACIAAALLRHRARLTSLDERPLVRGLQWLAALPWADALTRALAAEALSHLVEPPPAGTGLAARVADGKEA